MKVNMQKFTHTLHSPLILERTCFKKYTQSLFFKKIFRLRMFCLYANSNIIQTVSQKKFGSLEPLCCIEQTNTTLLHVWIFKKSLFWDTKKKKNGLPRMWGNTYVSVQNRFSWRNSFATPSQLLRCVLVSKHRHGSKSGNPEPFLFQESNILRIYSKLWPFSAKRWLSLKLISKKIRV